MAILLFVKSLTLLVFGTAYSKYNYMGAVMNWSNPLHKPYPLFLLGLGVIIAYVPGILGAAISTGWFFLFLTVPILFLFCEVKLGLGFLFILYAVISLLWTADLNIAWFYLLQLIILGCLFHIGTNLKDLKNIIKGLAFGLGISALLAVAQKFGFHSLIYTLNDKPSGLFINPNIYSETSAIILVCLVVFKLWWWIPVTLPGLILVQSRAAFLGLGIGLFFYIWKLNKYLAISSVFLLSLIVIAVYWNNFNTASIYERLDLWVDTIKGLNFFGNGVGSYETLFPYYATHIDTELARPKYAHNDFLQIVFELGIGSILFLLVLLDVFKTKRIELPILFTIGIISLFTYPLHTPASAFLAFLVAGYLSSDVYSNGDNRVIS